MRRAPKDSGIVAPIRRQEAVGLQAMTDGGFRWASTRGGSTLAKEEQWAKLRMIVETAEAVWG